MKPLSKIMVALALGVVLGITGISSCKKSQQSSPSSKTYSNPFQPGENFTAGDNFHVSQTPVPSSLLLLGSGVAGIALLRWKTRTKP
jgi:PEP-CTERM motif